MKSSFHNTQSWGESFCAKRIFERALNWLCTSVGWVLPTSLWERQRRERCIVTLDTSHQSPWGATGCIVSRTAGEIFNGQPKYQIAKISPSFLQRLIEAVCYPSQMYSDELNHNLNDCVVSTINQENLQNYQNLILWKRFRNGAFHAKRYAPSNDVQWCPFIVWNDSPIHISWKFRNLFDSRTSIGGATSLFCSKDRDVVLAAQTVGGWKISEVPANYALEQLVERCVEARHSCENWGKQCP